MSNIDNLIKQIQSQGTTSKWTGGYGAEAATKDMARILDSIGITDINQFGPVTKQVELYMGESPDGTPIYQTQEEKTFGNKITGQAVPVTYSERQTGNAFGGTFEGKGNTGYRVDFTPDGKPVFYTTGASSSDVGQYMPIIQAALAATGAGGLLGNALLGAGANQVAAGALGGALLGGGASALTGQDILKGALIGGAGGALSGYLNPTTGQVSATPTEGSIPVVDGVPVDAANPTSGYYNEITGKFVTDPLGGLTEPLTNATSGTNIGSMAGYNYNPTTGDWTLPTGEVIGTTVTPNPVTSGGDIMRNAGALPPVAPVDAKTAAKAGLTASDVIRAAGVAATIAGLNQATKPTGGGGFPIVPIPSDWTSPIKPTGTAAFTPLAPIDFGNKEMLRGTQWEKLLSPDYGKAPAMPTSTNPSNMTFNELTRILGGSRESIPTQNLSINDVIAGIQSQYGQTPQGSMG